MSDPNRPDPVPGDHVPAGSEIPEGSAFESSLAGAGTPSLRDASPSREPRREEQRTTVRVRRSPKLSGFALAGVMVGVVVALVLTFAFPEDEEFSPSQVFGFLLIFSAVVFGAFGVVVALVIEAVSRKRAREIQADRQVTTGDSDA